MRRIETHKLSQATKLDTLETLQTYNALDCCLTLEIFEELGRTYGKGEGTWGGIYSFERALQAPYFDLMTRGIRVDEFGRRQASEALRTTRVQLEKQLDTLASAIWDRGSTRGLPSNSRRSSTGRWGFPRLW